MGEFFWRLTEPSDSKIWPWVSRDCAGEYQQKFTRQPTVSKWLETVAVYALLNVYDCMFLFINAYIYVCVCVCRFQMN
jgi:hypothetical protein